MISTLRRNRGGNALFIILIAVALFAALSYAVTRSSGGSNPSADREKQALNASLLLQYATQVEQTVNRLLVTGGCTDTEISFENSIMSIYENPNSPSGGDKTCWVFDTNGGGMTPLILPEHMTGYPGANATWRGVHYNGKMAVEDIGTTAGDLIITTMVTLPLCDAINRILGLPLGQADSIPTNHLSHTGPFVGVYASTGVIGDNIFPSGKYTGCFNRSNGGQLQHVFYHVLIAR